MKMLYHHSNREAEVKRQVEKMRNSLALEVAEVVSVEQSCMNISHFLCHPPQCGIVEKLLDGGMIEFVVSSADKQVEGPSLLPEDTIVLPNVCEQLRLLASAQLTLCEKEALFELLYSIVHTQKDLSRENAIRDVSNQNYVSLLRIQ